jgi:hypothetical protein
MSSAEIVARDLAKMVVYSEDGWEHGWWFRAEPKAPKGRGK